jgi:hypothetical protein
MPDAAMPDISSSCFGRQGSNYIVFFLIVFMPGIGTYKQYDNYR